MSSNEAIVDCPNNFAATTDSTKDGLSRKQEADMEMFWGKYVMGDRRLLFLLCREFRHYTVEILVWVPHNDLHLFQREIAWDS